MMDFRLYRRTETNTGEKIMKRKIVITLLVVILLIANLLLLKNITKKWEIKIVLALTLFFYFVINAKKNLEIGSEAKVVFPYIKGSKLYAYCNKHGMWSTDVE